MTAVVQAFHPFPDKMARQYNPERLIRGDISASNSTSYGYVYPNGVSQEFYYDSELPWTNPEGQQYFTEPNQVYSHHGFPADFQTNSMDQIDATGLNTHVPLYSPNQAGQWTASDASAPIEAANMSRWTSQASHMSGPTGPGFVDAEQIRSARLLPTLSQMSFPISSSHPDPKEFSSAVSEASVYAFSPDADYGLHYTPLSPPEEDFVSVNAFEGEAQTKEEFSYPIFAHRDSAALYASMAEMPSSTIAETAIFATMGQAPYTNYHWDNTYNSPISSPGSDDSSWNMPRLTTGSKFSKDHAISNARSPRNTRKMSLVQRDSKDSGHMRAAISRHDLVDSAHIYEELEATDRISGRRISTDSDSTARDHPLYQNATVRGDGLYHCPWEGEMTCTHRPEKLKCNYDKFVDSHLKPYRCKVSACGEARFSSTACLLRHEREAHGMHGHGAKPFRCTYDGCERSIPGNGFPRRWNLCDHMRRVHNDNGKPHQDNGKARTAAGGSPTPSGRSTKATSKKRRTVDSASMKKSQSPPPSRSWSRAHAVSGLQPQWEAKQNHLREFVQSLQDPSNAEAFMDVESCLGVLNGTAQAIRTGPKPR